MPQPAELPAIQRQPNSKLCFVCGLSNAFGLQLRFDITAPGEVTSLFTVPERYQGFPGVVHGGIVAAMLDETAGRAHMGNADNPRFMFTAKLEVKYRKNVPIGKPLKIVGKAVRDNGRSAEGWAGIYNAETGELLAEGNTLLVNVPQEKLSDTSLDDLGWKVYPE